MRKLQQEPLFLKTIAVKIEEGRLTNTRSNQIKILFVSALLLFVSVHAVCAYEVTPPMPETDYSSGTISVPYAFFNENFGFAAGYVHSAAGYPQEQATLLGTVMAGTKGSAMGFLTGFDLLMPGTERLFIDPVASIGYFSDAESYIDGNPEYTDERAGSNDSHKDNFVDGDGWDYFYRVRFKYLLPIGNGRDEIIQKFDLEGGLPKEEANDGNSWGPLSSGRSYVELMPFYRSQQIDGDDVDSELKTNGLELALFWDNRDFPSSPSRGNSWRAKLTRDFGWMDSSESWTSVSGEVDHYVPLDFSDTFRQSVLAFNLWSSYSMSWDEVSTRVIKNRPPAFSGSTLGGLWHMRGFPTQRFSDKAAIYYASELRLIPYWNPFDKWPQLQEHIGVEWLQFVPFVELGRVGPSWDVSELHSDMKWCAGVGLRVWAKGIVVRVDTAISEESVGVQMMVSQPFQF